MEEELSLFISHTMPLSASRRRSRSICVALLAVSAVRLGAQAPVLSDSARGGTRMPPIAMMMMGTVQPDRPVLAQFDRDRNGRLDRDERSTARTWLATQPATTPFGRGGPPMPPGAPRMPMPPAGGPGRGFGPRVEPSAPGPTLSPDTVGHLDATVGFYAPNALRTLFIAFDSPEWEAELEDFYHTDVEVPATVRVDGIVYRNVGVRFRGNSSYMMVPRGSKRSLNLSLDATERSQSLLGYRSLNLLNANGDPTLVRTALFSHIASQYLPTPRANFARVVINGELWGIYANVQQVNREFFRDVAVAAPTARWKVPGSPMARGGLEYLGDSIAPYRARYEIKTRDDSAAWRALIRLARVLHETPVDRLESALSPLLDIDQALRFLAVDMALVNSDGYWSRASDYTLYQDSTGRFHVMPHDMNEALIIERPPPMPPGMAPPQPGIAGSPPGMRGPMMMMTPVTPTVDPLIGLDDPRKPLRSKLLAVPALRARYLAYVREIAERWLDWSRVGPMVTQWHEQIAPTVAVESRKLFSTAAFQRGLTEGDESLRSFMVERRAYLLRVIDPAATHP
jgi:hypothetical protein